jgi:hypothetical protein
MPLSMARIAKPLNVQGLRIVLVVSVKISGLHAFSAFLASLWLDYLAPVDSVVDRATGFLFLGVPFSRTSSLFETVSGVLFIPAFKAFSG